MRDFNPVQTCFWLDLAIKALPLETRHIALYLMTGPHTTVLGCFRCPKSYVAEDLKLSVEQVAVSFRALAAVGFFSFDEETGWCVVHDFLKWNPIHNPSHAQALEKAFASVPRQGAVFQTCCALLQGISKYLSAGFVKAIEGGLDTLGDVVGSRVLDTVEARCDTPCRHRDTDRDTDRDRDTDTETDTEIVVITRKEQEKNRGVLPHIVAPARQGEGDPPPLRVVFDYWRATLGHPQAVLDDKRKALIRRALKSGYTPEQLCQAITGCSLTPYNLGKNDRGQRYDGLHVILKDADQIDRFIRNAQNPPRERNAAEALIDSNLAVCQEWLQEKGYEIQ